MSEKEEASKSGKTVLATTATGTKTWPTVTAGSFTPTETSMRDTGGMIRLTDKGNTPIWMGLSMKAIGKKTSNMKKEKRNGPMARNTKGNIRMGRNWGKATSLGQMDLTTEVYS